MKVVIISSPDKFHSEIKQLKSLFESGLDTFHVRKPKFSYRKLNEYLEMIPSEFRDRCVIHSHHRFAIKYKLKGIHMTRKHRKSWFFQTIKLFVYRLLKKDIQVSASFHSLSSLSEESYSYDYVFLSPIFDSISKTDHFSAFDEGSIQLALSNTKLKVFALGGVYNGNLLKTRELGFSGAALLGTIWNTSKDSVETYREAIDIITGRKKAREVVLKPVKVAM